MREGEGGGKEESRRVEKARKIKWARKEEEMGREGDGKNRRGWEDGERGEVSQQPSARQHNSSLQTHIAGTALLVQGLNNSRCGPNPPARIG